MPGQARGERVVAGEHADLDVAIECGLGEVGRGDKRRLLVGDDGLRVQHALGPVRDPSERGS